jgi:VWFA-related protein
MPWAIPLRSKLSAIGVIVAAIGAIVAAAQQPPAVFKSSIDLVPVDVSVVDKNGRPVPDLTAEDFALSVDGKPRTIATAQFVSVAAEPVARPADPPYYSSNAGGSGGRLVMFVVDVGSIGAGRGKAALDAAARFVSTLKPNDRVGLVTVPAGGVTIDFTSDHARVESTLRSVIGQATDHLGPAKLGIADALGLERGDDAAIRHVADRECSTGDTSPQGRDFCIQQLMQDAQLMLTERRDRAHKTLASLRTLFERLSSSETPKTLVFMSEGLPQEGDTLDLTWVSARASAAHITMYILQLDPPDTDATAARMSTTKGADREALREGLDAMAALTRGDVMRVVSNADFAFQRVALELSGYYLLSFEPQPGDRDSKPHKIRIDSRRKDVEVRARREFSAGAPAAKSTEDLVIETLRSPLLAADIPLRLTTYSFRDAATSKLKIVLAVEIDRSANSRDNVALAYLLTDASGRAVVSNLERKVSAPIEVGSHTQKYVGAAAGDAPGIYSLKVAVVDDTGRRGSVERTFEAKLTSFGQVRTSDLLIADNAEGMTAEGLTPSVSAVFSGDELHGHVELMSQAEDQLARASVSLEVAESADAKAIDSARAVFQQTPPGETAEHRRSAEAVVPIALLPPGEYVARAVISIDGRKVGQVVRPFRIAAHTVESAGRPRAALPSATAISVKSRIDAFDKSSVLTPQVVGFFLDRLGAAAATSATTVGGALDATRAGHFDAALQALKDAGNDQLATRFLKGIALLARGELNPAANEFREALRLDSEFFPAAFYLGACYAAGGRDREAVGAWQTSLITEANAPFIYTLLGDALLRLRDGKQAVEALTEAHTHWPADNDVTLRLGTALIMAGQPAEGLRTLEPYLAQHPEDGDRLFLAMRALYEARRSGHPIVSAEEDRATFMRYAAAYSAAKGSQQALVDQWRKFFGK